MPVGQYTARFKFNGKVLNKRFQIYAGESEKLIADFNSNLVRSIKEEELYIANKKRDEAEARRKEEEIKHGLEKLSQTPIHVSSHPFNVNISLPNGVSDRKKSLSYHSWIQTVGSFSESFQDRLGHKHKLIVDVYFKGERTPTGLFSGSNEDYWVKFEVSIDGERRAKEFQYDYSNNIREAKLSNFTNWLNSLTFEQFSIKMEKINNPNLMNRIRLFQTATKADLM